MPTIRDVAAKAGVHPSTVSRVFSGRASISPETRRRVLEAAQALNFQPNAIARSLSEQRTRTIGIVVPHVFNGFFEDSFFPQVMQGLLRATYAAGYRILVSGSSSHQDEIDQVREILGSRQADGIVVMSSRLDVDTVGTLQSKGTPFVLLGHPPADHPGVAWADADNRQATREAVSYLIGLGHRRIAYVGGDPDVLVTKERLQGYRDALEAAGIRPHSGWIDYGYFAEDGGYQAVARMMALGDQAPTAYYAANDLMALGILRGLRERGIPVPQAVSVVGTNDSPEAGHVHPALTSLHVPYAAMAEAAASMLIQAIEEGRSPTGFTLLPCRLVVRETTARIPAEAQARQRAASSSQTTANHP